MNNFANLCHLHQKFDEIIPFVYKLAQKRDEERSVLHPLWCLYDNLDSTLYESRC